MPNPAVAPAVIDAFHVPHAVADVETRTADYGGRARAGNTRCAYRAEWADFAASCTRLDATALPDDLRLVARYVSDRVLEPQGAPGNGPNPRPLRAV